MANRAYLLNTHLATSDPDQVRETSAARALDYAEAATAANRVPIAWLCCFRQADLQSFTWQPEQDDDEPAGPVTIALPVIALSTARANLRAALAVFEAVTGETALARLWWEHAVAGLETLALPWLSLDAMEVLYAGDPDEYAQALHAALSGGADAAPALKWLSGYESGALPEAPDVFYAAPSAGGDRRRKSNAAALDAALGSPVWFRAPAPSSGATAPIARPAATARRAPTSRSTLHMLYAGLVAAAAYGVASYVASSSHEAAATAAPPAAAASAGR